MSTITFATLAVPGPNEWQTLWLLQTLRSFGGAFSNCPVQVLVPSPLGALTADTQAGLRALEAVVHPFDIDPDQLKFPFAAKIAAAAALEDHLSGESGYLAFFDRDTLFLNTPRDFVLPAGISLGYRPVHHKLIGLEWMHEQDPFWEYIFGLCEVPSSHLFPMQTHVGETIYPYFTAGFFLIKPALGLMNQWQEKFIKVYRDPTMVAFYERSQLYAIFIHQAVFTGVLVANLPPDQMRVFSPEYNYPLHLQADIPEELRPASSESLVTVRYEDLFSEADWQQHIKDFQKETLKQRILTR